MILHINIKWYLLVVQSLTNHERLSMKIITKTLMLTLALTSGNLLQPPLEAGKDKTEKKSKKSLKIKHHGKKFSPVDALFFGAKKGDTNLVRQTLEQEVDINAQDDQGCTALYWAVGHSRTAARSSTWRPSAAAPHRATSGPERTSSARSMRAYGGSSPTTWT